MTEPQDGAWCHIEIAADDVEKAKNFYGECFGWKFTDIPDLNYHIYTTREGHIGGGLVKKPEGFPNQMLNYVYVEDIDAASERVKNNGGRIVQPKGEVSETGWYTVVADPEGNVFGLWQRMDPS